MSDGGREDEMDIEDTRSEEERRAIASLAREIAPPAGLEERTVEALRRRGLLAERRPGRPVRMGRVLAAAAAAVLVFAAGLTVGRFTAAEPAAPNYMLLLRTGPVPDDGEAGARVQEYAAWARAEAARGRVLDGEKLEDGGRVLGPADDGGGAVEGFFLLRAASYDEAVAIAGGCPHVKYGGIVEVRRIEPTG